MDAKGRYAVLLLMLCASTPLVAQTVGDLSDVQSETLLLRAQAARAEAQAKLSEIGGSGGAAALGADGQLPVVRGVYGTTNALYATFLFANGSTVDARAGDVIPGGFVVRSLSATRVQLGRRGRNYTVGFSDVRPLTPAANAEATSPARSLPSPTNSAAPIEG